MTKVKCVFLDLGKVLLEFDVRHFGDRIRRLTDLDPEQVRSALTADGLAARYESGQIGDADFHREVCERMGKPVPWGEFTEAWNSIFLPEPLLTGEMLSRLAGRAPLWALSNTNRIHFAFIRENYPVMGLFNGYILSYEVGLVKPDPGIFRHALKMAQAQASESLFIDDQEVNVEAARGVGMDAFRFSGPDHMAAELRARSLI